MSVATERLARWEHYWQREELEAWEGELRSLLEDFEDLVVQTDAGNGLAAKELLEKCWVALDGLLNAHEVLERLTAELSEVPS